MAKSVQITTPWPTPEEMVKHFRISKARQKELAKILDKGLPELSTPKRARVNTVELGKKRKRASAA
jgi:hypothetical protein